VARGKIKINTSARALLHSHSLALDVIGAHIPIHAYILDSGEDGPVSWEYLSYTIPGPWPAVIYHVRNKPVSFFFFFSSGSLSLRESMGINDIWKQTAFFNMMPSHGCVYR
jgi:hypothetical protein